ncbi:MAG: GNAT family N-acetyltransferase [Methanomicrobiales archaeon]
MKENPPLTRDLIPAEFPLVKEVWYHYHQQEANPAEDRIFGTFVDGTLAVVVRCRQHPDGHEVDGVFTLEEFRGHDLARLVMQALIDACGYEELYMHSTLQLISFYKTFGFVPIPEDQLPKMIRERFLFCFGEMAGCKRSARCGGRPVVGEW